MLKLFALKHSIKYLNYSDFPEEYNIVYAIKSEVSKACSLEKCHWCLKVWGCKKLLIVIQKEKLKPPEDKSACADGNSTYVCVLKILG